MPYEMPASLTEALDIRGNVGWQIVAGGTDVYPANVDAPPLAKVLDISRIAELKGIQQTADAWRIGALTTWAQLLKAKLPVAFDALKLAAREVGSVQIQNAATMAGNLCNASPAADGIPPLLILNARVELRSAAETRELALTDFILGNRRTAMRADELMTAIVIPRDAESSPSYFVKLGSRKYLVISIAMVAAQLRVEKACISHARVAVGACSVVAQRVGALERALIGLPVDADIGAVLRNERLAELRPIDDIRASAAYRRDVAKTLVRRSIEHCLERVG